MMVEMSTKSNIGRYTGYYYTSSMIAQTLTPIAVGFIMAFVNGGLKLLFYYALIMMIIALVVFIQFKENQNAVKQIKKGLSSFDVDD
jgi:MFS family permease